MIREISAMPTNTGGKADASEKHRGSGRAGAAGEARGRARGAVSRAGAHDAQMDLVTAALIGLAVGVSATLLLRRGPKGVRPISPVMQAAARASTRGARWVRDRGEEAWDRVPRDEIADQVQDYARSARDAIDRAVHSELRTLRRALRAQARRVAR
jgi:signal transduction histidine kinase